MIFQIVLTVDCTEEEAISLAIPLSDAAYKVDKNFYLSSRLDNEAVDDTANETGC